MVEQSFLPDDTRGSHAGTRHDSTKGSNDQLVESVVHFVDVFNYTFDSHTTAGINFKGVAFPEIQVDRSGTIRYPSCGDRVVVRIGTGNQASYVSHASQVEATLDNSKPTFKFTEKPRDHQYLRTPKMPGDWEWFAKGGAFLSLMRGGMLKFGASPMCQFVMGKWENFWRMISQNWEIFSCGMNAYSINHDGQVTTRFSFFRKDTYGQHFHTKPKEWSARSDYDLMIDKGGLNFLGGEVEEKVIELGGFLRKNRIKIFINMDGTLIISQGLIPEENAFRQEIRLGQYGKFFEHNMWNSGGDNVYEESIHVDDGKMCIRTLSMDGIHSLNVTGTVNIFASAAVNIDAPVINLGSTEKASNVVVNGVKFTGNVPAHSFSGE